MYFILLHDSQNFMFVDVFASGSRDGHIMVWDKRVTTKGTVGFVVVVFILPNILFYMDCSDKFYH